jgi:hypothetical protein
MPQEEMKSFKKHSDLLKVEMNPYKLIHTKDARFAIINTITKKIVATFDHDELQDAEQSVENRNAMHQKNIANQGKYFGSLKGQGDPKFFEVLNSESLLHFMDDLIKESFRPL